MFNITFKWRNSTEFLCCNWKFYNQHCVIYCNGLDFCSKEWPLIVTFRCFQNINKGQCHDDQWGKANYGVALVFHLSFLVLLFHPKIFLNYWYKWSINLHGNFNCIATSWKFVLHVLSYFGVQIMHGIEAIRLISLQNDYNLHQWVINVVGRWTEIKMYSLFDFQTFQIYKYGPVLLLEPNKPRLIPKHQNNIFTKLTKLTQENLMDILMMKF